MAAGNSCDRKLTKMPTLIFIEPNDERREVLAEIGESAMQAATRHGVDGIIGECGGSCMCATCHCYVALDAARPLAPLDVAERETLEFTASHVRADSRLACQIRITEALDGLVLRVAER